MSVPGAGKPGECGPSPAATPCPLQGPCSPEVCPWVSDYGWEHPEDRVRSSLDSLLSKGSRASHHAAQSGAAPEK